jgi:hypothetical protein
VPPGRLRPKLARDLETICLKCLEKDVHGRYATSDELAADLRRFIEDRPIRARPVGLLGRVLRWSIRYPALAGASGLAVLLLLGVAGVSVALRNTFACGPKRPREWTWTTAVVRGSWTQRRGESGSAAWTTSAGHLGRCIGIVEMGGVILRRQHGQPVPVDGRKIPIVAGDVGRPGVRSVFGARETRSPTGFPAHSRGDPHLRRKAIRSLQPMEWSAS